MKAYFYGYLGGLSDNYHDGGALVIITAGDPQEAANKHLLETASIEAPTLPEPDFTYNVHKGQPERVEVYLDSGCC